MTRLFISDLHLSEEQPELTALFLRFLDEQVQGCEALYILGDLFEVWLGDDDTSPLNQIVIGALRAVSDRGVRLFFMHGNRDFLLGPGFERLTGGRLLPEPSIITVDDTPALLMHGDTLCTDDIEYQQFRAQVRDPCWQAGFLALPLAERQRLAGQAREQSRTRTREKSEEIMDVSPGTVRKIMAQHGVQQLIHGHTHRPGIHYFHLDNHFDNGQLARRIVLGDWGQYASVLVCEDGCCELITWPGGEPADRSGRST